VSACEVGLAGVERSLAHVGVSLAGVCVGIPGVGEAVPFVGRTLTFVGFTFAGIGDGIAPCPPGNVSIRLPVWLRWSLTCHIDILAPVSDLSSTPTRSAVTHSTAGCCRREERDRVVCRVAGSG
jgi:hypothetical protein